MRLINVDALIERLKPYAHRYDDDEIPYSFIYYLFIHEIEQEPTADAVLMKHGYWLWNDYGGVGNYHCSECFAICNDGYDYCPHCGAKMDK